MCGIIAILSNDKPVSPKWLSDGMARMSHRGPDEQGCWVAPNRRVGLGTMRLSIIDLATGKQPIANENERIHIVVNGEFYGHDRIRRELQQRGHRLRTRSDSEVALHLYEETGTACLKHLRGEFAFMLWDENNDVLFAARDRFGIKPLYYAWVGETLYLASEAKALFAVGVPADWDHESFFQSCHFSLDQDRTLFRGVYQVPPGHFLLATRKHLQLVQYWDLSFPRADDLKPEYTEAEHIERLKQALDEAVKLRLRSDVPVGCYLSGGIDSSTLLGMAAANLSSPIDAFTVGFDNDPYNEETVAEKTAKRTGAKYHPLRVSEEDLADHFADATWYTETLLPNPNVVAKYLLSRKARDTGCKVVLTGEGADEIFGGYAYLHRDMLLYNSAEQDLGTIDQRLGKLHGFGLPQGGIPALPTESVRQTLGFVPSLIEASAEGAFYQRALFSPEFYAEFADRDPYRMFLNRLNVDRQLSGREPVHQSLYLLTKSVLPNFLLSTLGDRVEMAHSIEGRLPFLDHYLVELVQDMPVSMKLRGPTEKYVLREAARPFVTDAVYRRRKFAFWSPSTTSQNNGKLHQFVQDTLRSSTLATLPFFDQKSVVALLDALPTWRHLGGVQAMMGVDAMLNTIVSACILHERFRLHEP